MEWVGRSFFFFFSRTHAAPNRPELSSAFLRTFFRLRLTLAYRGLRKRRNWEKKKTIQESPSTPFHGWMDIRNPSRPVRRWLPALLRSMNPGRSRLESRVTAHVSFPHPRTIVCGFRFVRLEARRRLADSHDVLLPVFSVAPARWITFNTAELMNLTKH